jgi:hypothetical protein
MHSKSIHSSAVAAAVLLQVAGPAFGSASDSMHSTPVLGILLLLP